MSIAINIISGRKQALSKLLKAAAEFIEGAKNERVSAQLTIEMNPKEKEI